MPERAAARTPVDEMSRDRITLFVAGFMAGCGEGSANPEAGEINWQAAAIERAVTHLGLKCAACGAPATWYGPDPFAEAVFPEDGPYDSELWCDECFGSRADEV